MEEEKKKKKKKRRSDEKCQASHWETPQQTHKTTRSASCVDSLGVDNGTDGRGKRTKMICVSLISL
jgi:hypothetical protein